jgi:dolichol kinase
VIVGYAALAAVLAIAGAKCGFYPAGLAGVILAAVAELFQKQLKVDDNFSIPLCVGAVLFITSIVI